MTWIKDFGIECLAELIKWSSPWFICNSIYRVCKQICLYGFLVFAFLACLLIPFPEHTGPDKSVPPPEGSFPLIPAEQVMDEIFASSPSVFFLADEEFNRIFPTPEELKYHVELWKDIFSRYTSQQIVIHDSWHFQVVYAVVNRDDLITINAIIRKYRSLLQALAQNGTRKQPKPFTAEEKHVYNLFAAIPEKDKFHKAAARPMLAQCGQRENFLAAIRRSGLYQQKFSQIFRASGLPVELTSIPFVESYFHYRAYSRAKAAGVWQFIPSTAKMYGLQINDAIDERYDPFKSAVSAAKLLQANYEIFQSWPLAITAYNHGPTGLLKAIRQTGTTDFGKIVRTYRGANFGFYSQNYYAQFLAVVQIMREPHKYFGDEIEQLPPLRYDEVRLTQRMFLDNIATLLSIPKEELVTLNRDLKPSVVQSKTPVPQNYILKLPSGKKQQLLFMLREQAAIEIKDPGTQREL
jgi:membrane-bound lytic murein transglycosylase D